MVQDIDEVRQVLGSLKAGAHWVHITYMDRGKYEISGYRVYQGPVEDKRYVFRDCLREDAVPLGHILTVRVLPFLAYQPDTLPLIVS